MSGRIIRLAILSTSLVWSIQSVSGAWNPPSNIPREEVFKTSEQVLGRPDIKLNFGRTSFRAGEAIEVLGPIHAGDVLDVRSSLKTVYTKTGRSGTMCFVVWETSFTNKEGERVIAIQESMVRR